MHRTKSALITLAVALALACAPMFGCSGSAGSSSAQNVVESSVNPEYRVAQVVVWVDPSGAGDAAEGFYFGPVEKPTQYDLTQGLSAFMALANTGVQLSGSADFVTAINGLENGANGENSGWMYKVNGVVQDVPANQCFLNEGDELCWYYGTYK